MRLSEALSLRKDVQKGIEQLRERAANNAVVQEGETPAEDPMALIGEAMRAGWTHSGCELYGGPRGGLTSGHLRFRCVRRDGSRVLSRDGGRISSDRPNLSPPFSARAGKAMLSCIP